MLILTRRTGESPIVGQAIEVRIVDVHRHQVRIGIDAPVDVSIVREESRDDPNRPRRASTE